MPILGCLDMLATLLDESDPDVDEANLLHAYQTAEKIREAHPDKPWMHLAGTFLTSLIWWRNISGLVHDLGKIMSVWGEEQWAVTGDTYPVGCAPAESIVYGTASFKGNLDIDHEVYGTKLGMYEEKCGLENLLMTWSHDEYMYKVLVNHGSTLPDEALYAIRFHSFYPYHSHDDYLQFQNERDVQMKPAIMMLKWEFKILIIFLSLWFQWLRPLLEKRRNSRCGSFEALLPISDWQIYSGRCCLVDIRDNRTLWY